MSTELVNEPSQGMSTRKKWLIGCGGCLGLIVILAIIITIIVAMGWDALNKASGQSVKEIFGPSYNSSGYTAMGLPLGQPKTKNMAMLIGPDGSSIIFAIDTISSPEQEKVLLSQNPAMAQQFFSRMGSEFIANPSARSGASKLRSIQFDTPHYISLGPHKSYPVVYAIVEAKRSGKTSFMPCVAVMVPEANHRLITLISMAPKAAAAEVKASFRDDQAELEAELGRLIKDSELDDRLVSSQSK